MLSLKEKVVAITGIGSPDDPKGNGRAIAELFAFLSSTGTNAFDYLDSIYRKYGYHKERTENIFFEGAEGSSTISQLASSYRDNPLSKVADIDVSQTKDFLSSGFIDEDEDPLPQENFIKLILDNGFSIAIRPSGTEPKIKYYLFGCGEPMVSDLEVSKQTIDTEVERIASWLMEDAHKRVKGT